MNRLCFLAFAFSFIATAAPLPFLAGGAVDAAAARGSVVAVVGNTDMLCNAIQELDHDVCGDAATVAQAPLCRVLSELNSTLCSAVRVFAHTGETMCPLLIFIDEVLCSNATTTDTETRTHAHIHINPAEFCPIIELADRELCGGTKTR